MFHSYVASYQRVNPSFLHPGRSVSEGCIGASQAIEAPKELELRAELVGVALFWDALGAPFHRYLNRNHFAEHDSFSA